MRSEPASSSGATPRRCARSTTSRCSSRRSRSISGPARLAEQLAWIDEHSGGHPAIVAVDGDGEVGGFASLTPYRPRPAYTTTVEDSVYVRRDLRGQGVGRLLLGDLVELARDHGFHSVIGRIVGDHDASIALHAACGFEQVGREQRGRPQVQPLARRRADADDAVSAAANARGRDPQTRRGPGWIRTNVAVTQRVYSPSPLATRVPTRI